MRHGNGRRETLAMLLFFAGTMLAGETAFAHHSSAVYDMEKRVTVKGTVTKVMWVNPHAYFLLDAQGGDDATAGTHWEILLNSPNEMTRSGADRRAIKPGDVVTVTAYPGRGDPTRAFAMFVTLADGTKVWATEK